MHVFVCLCINHAIKAVSKPGTMDIVPFLTQGHQSGNEGTFSAKDQRSFAEIFLDGQPDLLYSIEWV